MIQKIQPKYLFEIWRSNNRFCCNGRIMMGPKSDTVYNYIVWLIFIIGLIFHGLTSGSIWIEISPIALIISWICYIICGTLLFLCQFKDPGIIPKKEIINALNQNSLKQKFLIIDEDEKFQPICTECEIMKPSQAYHCQSCNNCVENFLHHCKYINNCIGKRNYSYYKLFIIFLLLTSILSLIEQILLLVLAIDLGWIRIIIIIFLIKLAIVIILLLIFSVTLLRRLKNYQTGDNQDNRTRNTNSYFELRFLINREPTHADEIFTGSNPRVHPSD